MSSTTTPVPGSAPVSLSVLDQSPITDHLDHAGAIRESLRLAQHVDHAGYRRIWFAEHHRSRSFAGSAPAVMTALALERTAGIRVGTGGILLPLYQPLTVAEIMGPLQLIHGDRVDIGVGRAGYTAEDFPEKLASLLELLPGGFAETASEPAHRVWVLGAGGSSAPLARRLKTGYVHGHFLNPVSTESSLRAYQDVSRGASGAAILAVRAVSAPTAEKAKQLAWAAALWRARKDLGTDGPIPSLERAGLEQEWDHAERARAHQRMAGIIHGTPEDVRDQLLAMAKKNQVAEVMVNTLVSDPAGRTTSYSLLAEALEKSYTQLA